MKTNVRPVWPARRRSISSCSRTWKISVDWDREQPEPKWGSALVLREISNLVLQDFQGHAARPEGPLPAVVESSVIRQQSPGLGFRVCERRACRLHDPQQHP
jgi:hypothetical protein